MITKIIGFLLLLLFLFAFIVFGIIILALVYGTLLG